MNFAAVIGMALFGAVMMFITQRAEEDTSRWEEAGWVVALAGSIGLMCNQVMIWTW